MLSMIHHWHHAYRSDLAARTVCTSAGGCDLSSRAANSCSATNDLLIASLFTNMAGTGKAWDELEGWWSVGKLRWSPRAKSCTTRSPLPRDHATPPTCTHPPMAYTLLMDTCQQEWAAGATGSHARGGFTARIRHGGCCHSSAMHQLPSFAPWCADHCSAAANWAGGGAISAGTNTLAPRRRRHQTSEGLGLRQRLQFAPSSCPSVLPGANQPVPRPAEPAPELCSCSWGRSLRAAETGAQDCLGGHGYGSQRRAAPLKRA